MQNSYVQPPLGSSHWRCSVRKVFLEISQNLQKTPAPESLFSQVAGLGRMNTFFTEHHWTTASALTDNS